MMYLYAAGLGASVAMITHSFKIIIRLTKHTLK